MKKKLINNNNLYISDILELSKTLAQNSELMKYIDLLILEISKLFTNGSYNSNASKILRLLLNTKKFIRNNINKRLVLEDFFFTLSQICNDSIKKVIYQILL
jgi:hypothetical protein